MTAFLPPTLLALFAPRPPLIKVPQLDHDPKARRGPKITGLAGYLNEFEDAAAAEAAKRKETTFETVEQRRARVAAERKVCRRACVVFTDPVSLCSCSLCLSLSLFFKNP